jgi:hypothetical protein
VLDALGGLLLVFEIPRGEGAKAEGEEALIREVGRVIKDGLGGWGWDGVAVAVGLGGSDEDGVWEDRCADAGLEFIAVGEKDVEGTKNEFGGMRTPVYLKPPRHTAVFKPPGAPLLSIKTPS